MSHLAELELEPGAESGAEPEMGRREPTLLEGAPENRRDVDERLGFTFTGSGREYFRIWIVNLCLTLATFGIYSAWAKVRRLQYFARNTSLDGAVFDFHGDAMAIFKGRLLAVLLFAAYHYAFGFSKAFGVTVVVFLFVSLPWLMRGALRFRLRNTSYRGIRFAFAGTTHKAYGVYLPMVMAFVLPAALLALDPGHPGRSGGAGLLYLAWPVWHARSKRYQQSNLLYGTQQAEFTVTNGAFYGRYFMAGLFALFGGILAAALAGAVSAFLLKGGQFNAGAVAGVVGAGFGFYFAYLFFGPYLEASIYNLTWSNTNFPNGWVESTLKPGAYLRLQALNVTLTLLTLGLYRPFAVVRAFRYRLEHTAVRFNAPFDSVLAVPGGGAGRTGSASGASGDGADDFLGFDLSW